jgi:hypothetical protein
VFAYRKYKKEAGIFKLDKTKVLGRAREPILAFFTDSDGQPNFITDYNTWYKIDTAGKLYAHDTITLDLEHLENRFRIFSLRKSAVLSIGSSIYFSPVWVELEDDTAYLKEPCIVSVSLRPEAGSAYKAFFKKPAFFGDFVNPHISYCFNGKEIVLLYPNSDTLYTCDPVSGKYAQYPLNNPSFSQPEIADQENKWESSYGMKYALHNFGYEAIWYNKNTGHYVVTYQTPVDKSIKVPTYDDQPLRAVVLNERFQPLQYLLFRERYFSNNVLQTAKGLAMPVYSKRQRNIQHDIPIRYYVYNF